MKTLNSLHNISDDELVLRCLHHDRNAWEVFFLRFPPCLKKAIRRTFIKFGASSFAEDIDNVMDIQAILVEKLYSKGILYKCPDLSGLRAWLNRIAINQTIGWMREKGRLKNLPRAKEEFLIKSLSESLNSEDDLTLEDIIADEEADLFFQIEQIASQYYVEAVLDQMAGIKNKKNSWILRLHILGQYFLSEDEISALSAFSPLTANEVKDRINILESTLSEETAELQKELGKATLSWHLLREIEIKIAKLDKDTFTDHKPEIKVLKAEWTQIDTERKEQLANACSLPKPSNSEIAELVGIPEKQCGDVSQYLIRARNKLRKILNNK